MRFPSLQWALPLAAALGLACAESSGGPAPAAEAFVTAEDDYFTPINVSIRVGGSVTWSVPGGPHTVTFTAPAAPPDCAATNAGETCVRVFPGRGTFDYGCQFHGAMEGTVRVD